ncbi:Uncharacterised protein [Klebsiella pneumoniae]|nr:Uncharacterised protein [Klebsiella pneumoniae]
MKFTSKNRCTWFDNSSFFKLKVDITPDIGRGSARRRGGYPDISQPSFHNSSIFTAPSLTKLVSFSETLQDETVN